MIYVSGDCHLLSDHLVTVYVYCIGYRISFSWGGRVMFQWSNAFTAPVARLPLQTDFSVHGTYYLFRWECI